MELVLPSGLPEAQVRLDPAVGTAAGGSTRAIYGSFGFRIGGTEYENHTVRTKLVEIGYGATPGTGGAAQGVIGSRVGAVGALWRPRSSSTWRSSISCREP